MQQRNIEELLKRYHAGECSSDEVAFLESWYAQWNEKIPVKLTAEQLAEDLHLISINVQPLHREAKQVRFWLRIAAAASILLILSAGGYFLLHNPAQQQVAQNQRHDIAPGRNQATLTLANGQKIVLTKGLSGKLAQQINATINANAGNAIAYNAISTKSNAAIEYNTMSTARGEQSPYPLILADGTKVWLNAASSIKYPTAFNEKNREVTITGEAYMEVAHNATKPFRVISKGQIIEDLGTQFDINAYEDEHVIKTTLVEGSIKVIPASAIATKTHVILKPGQQSILNNAALKVQNANVDQVVSWRNGKFLFDEEQLGSIMRQVSRWYNVEIVYEDERLKGKAFGGVTARFDNVSQLLNTLEMTNKVKFTIQGRKIIVQDK